MSENPGIKGEHAAPMLAVLLEAGAIVNRGEELKLHDPIYQAKLAVVAKAAVKNRRLLCTQTGPLLEKTGDQNQ